MEYDEPGRDRAERVENRQAQQRPSNTQAIEKHAATAGEELGADDGRSRPDQVNPGRQEHIAFSHHPVRLHGDVGEDAIVGLGDQEDREHQLRGQQAK